VKVERDDLKYIKLEAMKVTFLFTFDDVIACLFVRTCMCARMRVCIRDTRT